MYLNLHKCIFRGSVLQCVYFFKGFKTKEEMETEIDFITRKRVLQLMSLLFGDL